MMINVIPCTANWEYDTNSGFEKLRIVAGTKTLIRKFDPQNRY